MGFMRFDNPHWGLERDFIRRLVERLIPDVKLAAETCILRPSLTGILSRMERDNQILRLKPVNDQRKLYVSLTQQGQDLYDVARHQVEQGYSEIEAAFSRHKMEQLVTLLDELNTLGDQQPAAYVTAHPTRCD